MSEHTQEPWISAGKGALDTISDQFGSRIAQCMNKYEDEPRNYQVDYENARRIVACVNACAGIPTETLEAPTTILKGLNLQTERVDALLHEHEQQRDKLLGALKDAMRLLKAAGYAIEGTATNRMKALIAEIEAAI
jgi:septation ring formation regulator EzrA